MALGFFLSHNCDKVGTFKASGGTAGIELSAFKSKLGCSTASMIVRGCLLWLHLHLCQLQLCLCDLELELEILILESLQLKIALEG